MLGIMLLMLHELFVQEHSGMNVVSLRFWRASIRALKRSTATAIATSSRRHHEPHAQYTPCALSLTFVRVRPQAAEASRLTCDEYLDGLRGRGAGTSNGNCSESRVLEGVVGWDGAWHAQTCPMGHLRRRRSEAFQRGP